MAFSERRLNKGADTTRQRLNDYKGLRKSDNPELHKAWDELVEHLRWEGKELDKGNRPAPNTAAVDKFVRRLDRAKAFEVRATWWLAEQNKHWTTSGFQKALAEAAKKHVLNYGFWSKLTGKPAEARAEKSDGTTLEDGPAAASLDGVNYGHEKGKYSPTLGYLWDKCSSTAASKTRGKVHADVYEAIDPSSVLANREMPVLANRIEAGEVEEVTIHVRKRNSKTRVLEEVATFHVHSMDDFNALEKINRTASFAQRQNEEYITQNVGRSLLRNRQGLQHSLDGFEAFKRSASDPDALVFVTPLGQELPKMTASSSSLRRLQRHGSETDMQSPTPTATLYAKLAAQGAVQRQGSTSSQSTGYDQRPAPGLNREDSYLTTTTTHSSGSGGYLVPVNTVASDQRIYMSNPHQLPTGGQMAPFGGEVPSNPAIPFQTPDYEVAENPLVTTMSRMTISPGQADPVSASDQGYFDGYYRGNPSNYRTGTSYEGYYGAGASNPASGLRSTGGYGAGGSSSSSNPYYPTTSGPTPGYTMNTTLSNTQPQYTMNTALSNPTGGYARPVEGGSRSDNGSTSSSDGFGVPLSRVNANPSPSPSPPPVRRGRH